MAGCALPLAAPLPHLCDRTWARLRHQQIETLQETQRPAYAHEIQEVCRGTGLEPFDGPFGDAGFLGHRFLCEISFDSQCRYSLAKLFDGGLVGQLIAYSHDSPLLGS